MALGSWENGTAIKLEGNEWRVLMTGGKEMKISKQDLLNEKKYFIQHAFQSKMPQQ
jgi:hypothetical protein